MHATWLNKNWKSTSYNIRFAFHLGKDFMFSQEKKGNIQFLLN